MSKGSQSKRSSSQLQIFLRIKHPSIDPAQITRALGIEPEHAMQAGPAISETGVRQLHSESYWIASLPIVRMKTLMEQAENTGVSPASQTALGANPKDRFKALSGVTSAFDLTLLSYLRNIESQRDFLQRIKSEGGSTTLLIQRASDSGALSISPMLSKRLGEFDITLEIE